MSRANQPVAPSYNLNIANADLLEAVRHDPGLTIREHFAAMAPHEPQPWFKPTMRPRPKVPQWSGIEDPKTRADVRVAYECGTDPETPEGAAFIEHQREVIEADDTWRSDYDRERCIQWPVAWADAILAELAKPKETPLDEYGNEVKP